jgi:histone deacetylase 1/2
VSAKLWHCCLGHACFPVINKAISISPRNKLASICSDCQLAKSHAMPFKHVHVSVLKPLELIYSDVWGPAPVLSTIGARYYISFLDDATKYLWLFPLKLKSDAYQTFIYFQTVIERQFNTKIKALQSDWGGEFRSLHKYLHSQGINHRITCPYTH